MVTSIPYHVEINRVIELLASQIYQSPLALLRENCQNAYDAILQKRWEDPPFDNPLISVEISPGRVSIADNGVGMSPQDLDAHYWRAGSSGKNNPSAIAAGVVGTFGIGAMANFGVASEITVTTESLRTGQRTRSSVERDKLSATEPCITIEELSPQGTSGTIVDITVADGVPFDVAQAVSYIAGTVRYLPIPVFVNGQNMSGHQFSGDLPQPRNSELATWEGVPIAGTVAATVDIAVGPNAEPWIRVTQMSDGGQPITGELVLAQDLHQIHAFRSGFSLATVGVQSHYGLGGMANLSSLIPTAGRDSLSTSSIQFLQTIVAGLERIISGYVGTLPSSDESTRFMAWVRAQDRYDLCSNITIQVEPRSEQRTLGSFHSADGGPSWNLYGGRERSIIDSFANDERPLLVLAASQPRRDCQDQYLRRFADIDAIPDQPTILGTTPEFRWSLGESALAFRLGAILETDYFVPCRVQYGKITHGLPMLINLSFTPPLITLDSQSSTIAPILQLYETDYEALTGFVKDFIRNAIFSKIAHLVPSSTRDGAAAFLKSIRRPRDLFEYEHTDLGTLGEIWQEYVNGRISMVEAARQSASIASSTVQVLDPASAATVEEVLSDVIANENMMAAVEIDDELGPLPAITRTDIEATAKILLVGEGQSSFCGYRAFLALTDRARRENGDFFLQPHRTEIVWGGQKAMYIFQHHSGEFSLYYELQGNDLLPNGPNGYRIPTCTVVVKNQVYIPIPEPILSGFQIGPGERKSFEVRYDLLFPEPS